MLDREVPGMGNNLQAIKVDALWKPIIRKFRQHIKNLVTDRLNLRDMKEMGEEEMGSQFGKILGVPEELMNRRTHYALFMTVHSSRVTKDRCLQPEFLQKLGCLADSLQQNYFKIYFENSSKKRLLFFCEPLIQHLWTIFIS